MARYLAGGTDDDYVDSTYTLGSQKLSARKSGMIVTFYDAFTGGNQVTDLLSAVWDTASNDYVQGNPITQLTTDASGYWGPVWWPDGVTELWAQAVDPSVPNPPTPRRFKVVSVHAAANAVAGAEAASTAAAGHASDAAASAATAQDAAATATAPTDTTMAAKINTAGSATRVALDDAIAGGVEAQPPSKMIGSGYGFQVRRTDPGHKFLTYAPNGDMIGLRTNSNGGRTVSKSTDGGANWTDLGTPSATNAPGMIWITAAGTWIAAIANDKILMRSTDGGATWTTVLSPAGGFIDRSFTESTPGTLWFAEYVGDARVWRSTDDGATWMLVYNFPNTDGGDGTVIRHIHAMLTSSDGRVWCFTGDSGTECGFWTWDAGTSAFVRQSPALSDADGGQDWRAVSVWEREGSFYWIQDGADINAPVPPAIHKADPNDLAGTMVRLAEVPTGGWYISPLSTGELVVGSIAEPSNGVPTGYEKDSAMRLWVIDNDDAIHEALVVPYTSAPNTDYPGVRSLSVHPTDDTVSLIVNNTDFGGVSYVTMTGHVVKGGKPLAADRNSVPRAYADGARVWSAVPVTSSPLTNSTAAVVIPEMTLTIPATGRPLLLLATVLCHLSANTQNIGLRFYRDGTALGPAITSIPNPDYRNVPLMLIDVPPSAGDHTYEVRWFVSGSSVTADSTFKNRTFSVVEL